ncbi:MAG: hypothetical protein QOG64_2425 [Acidimicrobiaceae bacterium]|nr:hypothetical protein [Acidimicrobiaceae bacterium]
MKKPTTSARRPSALARFEEEMTRVTGLTSSGAVVVVLAVLAWLLARFIGGRPLFIVAYTLVLVLVASYAIGRRPLPIEGSRSDSRPRLAAGETVTMQVKLSARRRVSTFVLEEKVPVALGDTASLPVAVLEGGGEVEHDYRLTCRRRGLYELGPLVAKWGDPFGFTRREAVLVEPVEVLVHPAIETVTDRPLTRLFEDPPIRPPVSKPWPTGMEFYGMRQYSPGDDVRRIVWRAYARTGQLLVREAEQGITDKITILLDQDLQHHSRGEVSGSFEAGVRVAASVGVRHLRDGFSVALEGSQGRLVPVLRGGTSQLQLLDALARVERVKAPLNEAIMRLVGESIGNTHLVLITPRLDAEAAARLDLVLQRGISVLVAALLWGEESAETLGRASSLGAQVIEVRPNVPLAVAFRRLVGAGMAG